MSVQRLKDEMRRAKLSANFEKLHAENPALASQIVSRLAPQPTPAPASRPYLYDGVPSYQGAKPTDAPVAVTKTPEQTAVEMEELAASTESAKQLSNEQRLSDARFGGGGLPTALGTVTGVGTAGKAGSPVGATALQAKLAGAERELAGNRSPANVDAVNNLRGQIAAYGGGGVYGTPTPQRPNRDSDLARIVTMPGSDQPYLTNRTTPEMARLLAARYGGEAGDIEQFAQQEVTGGYVPPAPAPGPVVTPTQMMSARPGAVVPQTMPEPVYAAPEPIPAPEMPGDRGIHSTNLPTEAVPAPVAGAGPAGVEMAPEKSATQGAGLTPEEDDALALAISEGRISPRDINSRNAKYMAGTAVKFPGINFNELTAQAAYQRGANASNTKAILNAINPLFDRILQAGAKLDNTAYPFVNKPLNWLRKEVGNPDIIAFRNLRDDVIAEVEKGLMGTGVLSDTKYMRALENINDAQSPEQLAAAVRNIQLAVQTRLEATEAGPYPGAGRTRIPAAEGAPAAPDSVGTDGLSPVEIEGQTIWVDAQGIRRK